MDHTDPRYVAAQIDIGWAVCGASGHATPSDPAVGAAYVNSMIQKFGSRVDLLPRQGHGRGRHPPGLRRRRPAHGRPGRHQLRADVRVGQEQDEVLLRRARPGRRSAGRRTSTRSATAAESAVAMKGDPAPSLKASPKLFPSVPKGTPAAANQAPIKVTNDGDAPLVIANGDNAIRIQADDDDGGAATAADFAVVSENCRGKTLAPNASCTLNVGFKPTRTQLHLGRPHRDRLQQRRRRRADPDRRRADAAEGARVPRRRRTRPWTAGVAAIKDARRRRTTSRSTTSAGRGRLHRREPRELPRRGLPQQHGRPAQRRAGDRAAGLHPGRRRLRRHRLGRRGRDRPTRSSPA